MAISQKLHTKLVQKLILTPSLQQAIKLLPMSTLELSELLNQEMVENPMLEEVPTEELQPVEAAHDAVQVLVVCEQPADHRVHQDRGRLAPAVDSEVDDPLDRGVAGQCGGGLSFGGIEDGFHRAMMASLVHGRT